MTPVGDENSVTFIFHNNLNRPVTVLLEAYRAADNGDPPVVHNQQPIASAELRLDPAGANPFGGTSPPETRRCGNLPRDRWFTLQIQN